MPKLNFFIEGLQGAGKSTLVKRLSDRLPDYTVFHEGDYSPVELAWCAYVTEAQYKDILARYPTLQKEIQDKTVTEEEYRIICYTQILTDVPGFHKDLEKYEIYNQMLYFMMSDDEILAFYERLHGILSGKPYRILYLDVEDIAAAIGVIKKERSDDNGNELWFPLMLKYLAESPYGKEHALSGMAGLLCHLEKRRNLERRIIDRIFKENTIVVKAKDYKLDEMI